MSQDRVAHDLAVVIVNWNAGAWLERCVASVRASACALSIEVIVVDNASADGSPRLVERLDGVHLVANQDNRGFARACNQGIEATSSRYVMLLNPDAEAAPGALDAMVRFMDEHADVGAAGAALLNPDGSLQPSGWTFPTLGALLSIHPWIARFVPPGPDASRRRDFAATADVDEVSGAAVIVRRDALESVGLLDDGFFLYFEDIDLCRRLKRAGWRICYLPEARVVHEWRTRRAPSPEADVHHLRSKLYYVRKHFGPSASLLLRVIGVTVYTGLMATAYARRLLRRPGDHRREGAASARLLRVCVGRD